VDYEIVFRNKKTGDDVSQKMSSSAATITKRFASAISKIGDKQFVDTLAKEKSLHQILYVLSDPCKPYAKEL
jgi:hypothetical protein